MRAVWSRCRISSLLVVLVTIVVSARGNTATGTQAGTGQISRLPSDAKASISRALGRDLPGFRVRVTARGYQVVNANQKLSADFTASRVQIKSGGTVWGLALRGYGHGNDLEPVGPASPHARGNRVEYQRGGLVEWYANGPLGIEQGFTFAKRPVGQGRQPLTLAVSLPQDSAVVLDPSKKGLTLTARAGRAGLRYGDLTASDADGRNLAARIEVRRGQLLLKVNDAQARYPVVIDPLMQLAELTSSDGVTYQYFGTSVAISGDTVVVGAPEFDGPGPGTAYVFVKPATGWTTMTQTAELTASDYSGGDSFGQSVGISGNTIVVGAPWHSFGSNPEQGAAYVFLKPAGGWVNATQTAELSASDGAAEDQLGSSVSISGGTVVAGAPWHAVGSNTKQGAAYVFVRPASGWATTTQTAELTASDGAALDILGSSVAASGNTVMAGAPGFNPASIPGAAYVFVRPATGWVNMTETAELTASDGQPNDQFGIVAVDGDTALVGADEASAAYVFLEPTGGWTSMTETAKLTAQGESHSYFGYPVSISGKHIAIGATNASTEETKYGGATYLYTEPTGGWVTTSKPTARLTVAGEMRGTNFGLASVSGNTVAVGWNGAKVGNNTYQGAAYVFGP